MYEDADQEESMLEQQLSMETEYARHPHALKLFDPVPGMPVAVQREDTSWSRALIAQVLADQMCARVFYVDEGRYGRVSLSRLRYLRRELFTNEASPFRARLFGIRFSDAESEQQAFGFVYKTLSELADTKSIRIVVKNVVSDEEEKGQEQERQEDRSRRRRVEVNKGLYEIILRCPYEGRLTNLNVILTKLGYAECVDMSIYEGESEQQPTAPHLYLQPQLLQPQQTAHRVASTNESSAFMVPTSASSSAMAPGATTVAPPDDPSTTPKVTNFLMKAHKPTEIEREIKELVKDFMPSKVKTSPPANSVKCRVTSVVSPNEIWLQDVVDADMRYEQYVYLRC